MGCVSAWLRRLGLEHYTPAFRDNDVDTKVLRKLTADDLIGVGVTSMNPIEPRFTGR
jgi:hypothetical protein